MLGGLAALAFHHPLSTRQHALRSIRRPSTNTSVPQPSGKAGSTVETPMTRSLAEQQSALASYSDDERASLDVLMRKFEAGKAKYGPLSIDLDKRNFIDEATEELSDLALYLIFHVVRMRRRAA